MQKVINGVRWVVEATHDKLRVKRRGREGKGNRDIDIPIVLVAMALNDHRYLSTLNRVIKLREFVEYLQGEAARDTNNMDPEKIIALLGFLWREFATVEGRIKLIPTDDVNHFRTLRAQCNAELQVTYYQTCRVSAILSTRTDILNIYSDIGAELDSLLSREEMDSFNFDLLKKGNTNEQPSGGGKSNPNG